jgi:glycogen synthase kinase 3 beta
MEKIIGQGTFGTVYQAKINETGETVAIKKVMQDKTCKNRELQIMQQLHRVPHPFIMQLKYHYTTTGPGRKGSKSQHSQQVQSAEYLNLVLDFMPETLHSVVRAYHKRQEWLPAILIKSYLFQLLRALAHIHGMGIVHRDLKPQNILIDPHRAVLKLADFGSAKPLVAGEANVAYIGSRYYRAPELLLGCTEYTTAIDVWSAGCVFAEMMLGTPVFPGMSAADQLIEIVKVLGSPNEEQLIGLHRYSSVREKAVKIPLYISPQCLHQVFSSANPQPQAIALINILLDYHPARRVKAIDACAHPCFNELRLPGVAVPSPIAALSSLMPNVGMRGEAGGIIPQQYLRLGLPRNLLQFTQEELSLASTESLQLLVPGHTLPQQEREREMNSLMPFRVVGQEESTDKGIYPARRARGQDRYTAATNALLDDAEDVISPMDHSINQSQWRNEFHARTGITDLHINTQPASNQVQNGGNAEHGVRDRLDFIDRLLSRKYLN